MRTLALTAAALLISPLAFAQYTGPDDTTTYTTVKQILDKPVNDYPVRVTGTLVKKVNKETYLFVDGTGEIEAEIDDKLFHGKPVNDKVSVQLIGEVDTSIMRKPQIDVDALNIQP